MGPLHGSNCSNPFVLPLELHTRGLLGSLPYAQTWSELEYTLYFHWLLFYKPSKGMRYVGSQALCAVIQRESAEPPKVLLNFSTMLLDCGCAEVVQILWIPGSSQMCSNTLDSKLLLCVNSLGTPNVVNDPFHSLGPLLLSQPLDFVLDSLRPKFCKVAHSNQQYGLPACISGHKWQCAPLVCPKKLLQRAVPVLGGPFFAMQTSHFLHQFSTSYLHFTTTILL